MGERERTPGPAVEGERMRVGGGSSVPVLVARIRVSTGRRGARLPCSCRWAEASAPKTPSARGCNQLQQLTTLSRHRINRHPLASAN